jgi:hypothetical protein
MQLQEQQLQAAGASGAGSSCFRWPASAVPAGLLFVVVQQSSQHTFGRRLEQSDHFTDQFILRLDLGEGFQVVIAGVDITIDESCFQLGPFTFAFRTERR